MFCRKILVLQERKGGGPGKGDAHGLRGTPAPAVPAGLSVWSARCSQGPWGAQGTGMARKEQLSSGGPQFLLTVGGA